MNSRSIFARKNLMPSRCRICSSVSSGSVWSEGIVAQPKSTNEGPAQAPRWTSGAKAQNNRLFNAFITCLLTMPPVQWNCRVKTCCLRCENEILDKQRGVALWFICRGGCGCLYLPGASIERAENTGQHNCIYRLLHITQLNRYMWRF